MFQKLFDPDNGLMITMAQITDCIFLSMFWVLCSLPVLTVGAATAALYAATVHAYRKKDKHSWSTFFRVFREHLKPALCPTVVFLGAFSALAWGVIRIWNLAVWGEISWAVFCGGALLGAAALGVLSVMFPLLSRFETNFGTLMKNTVLLALANMPRTLALGMVNAIALFLCARFLVPLFLLPALAALIGTLFLEPMFRPYMPEEEIEEEEITEDAEEAFAEEDAV